MKYRVFDTSINKLFGVYGTEDEAMALVRALIGANGASYADDLALACERDDGSRTEAMAGAALLARADAVFGRDRSRSGGADPADAAPGSHPVAAKRRGST